MKHLLAILLTALCILAASAQAQVIKSLGYNTTNGHVVYNATNNSGTQLTLVFTNANGARLPSLTVGNIEYTTNAITFYGTNSGFQFSAGASAAQVRNNLGLGATNNVTFASVNIASLSANGSIAVTDGTNNFFAAGEDLVEFLVPIQIENSTGLAFSGTNAATAAATTRTNLGLGGGVITNIDVLVSGGGTNTLQFSNGILTNVTTP